MDVAGMKRPARVTGVRREQRPGGLPERYVVTADTNDGARVTIRCSPEAAATMPLGTIIDAEPRWDDDG